MPSDVLAGLSDTSLATILAYLRTLPVVEGPGPSLPSGRWAGSGVVTGTVQDGGDAHPAGMHRHLRLARPRTASRWAATSRTPPVRNATAPISRGDPSLGSVNLAVVSGYSAAEFARLLQTGVPKGERKLGLMGEAARGRFVALTPTEVAALYAYLHSRSGQS